MVEAPLAAGKTQTPRREPGVADGASGGGPHLRSTPQVLSKLEASGFKLHRFKVETVSEAQQAISKQRHHCKSFASCKDGWKAALSDCHRCYLIVIDGCGNNGRDCKSFASCKDGWKTALSDCYRWMWQQRARLQPDCSASENQIPGDIPERVLQQLQPVIDSMPPPKVYQ